MATSNTQKDELEQQDDDLLGPTENVSGWPECDALDEEEGFQKLDEDDDYNPLDPLPSLTAEKVESFEELNAPPPERKGPTLTKSQKCAVNQLRKMLFLKVYCPDKAKTVKLRSHMLLAGPSGTGKTETTYHFAKSVEWPIFSTSIMNWTVVGAKAEPPTLKLLNDFLKQHDFGVIFLDEINKLQKSHLDSGWFMNVFTEILCLLDADDRLLALNIEKEQIQKLRNSYVVVAAGAWQDAWNDSRPRPTAGFSPAEVSLDKKIVAFHRAVKEGGGLLPEELLFRFNERVIFLSPPTDEEIAERIVWIREEVGAPRLTSHRLHELTLQCQQSDRAFRWLEAYLNDVFEESPLSRQPEILLSPSEVKRTILQRCPEKKPANLGFPRLRQSLRDTVRKLTLDCHLLACALQEALTLRQRRKKMDKILALKELISACQKSLDPLSLASDETDTELRNACDNLLAESLCGRGGKLWGEIQQHQAVKLRARLRLLQQELQILRKLKNEEDALIFYLPDVPDPRQEWFQKL